MTAVPAPALTALKLDFGGAAVASDPQSGRVVVDPERLDQGMTLTITPVMDSADEANSIRLNFAAR